MQSFNLLDLKKFNFNKDVRSSESILQQILTQVQLEIAPKLVSGGSARVNHSSLQPPIVQVEIYM